MASIDVYFKYIFHTSPPLKYMHPFPRRLCRDPQPLLSTSRAYANEVYTAIHDIGLEHTSECDAKSEKKCTSCGKSRTRVEQIPITRTMDGPQPAIASMVTPLCASQECLKEATFEVYSQFDSFGSLGQPQGEMKEQVALDWRCEGCRTWGGVKKCTRCRRVGYCGRECQRNDWKKHKTLCREEDAVG